MILNTIALSLFVFSRVRKVLEERTLRDEEKIQVLEKDLEVTILFGEEADRKYEEVLTPPLYHFHLKLDSVKLK